ncbi:hypothetical protein MHBO_000189 [Bonamia ostreae]|uniref:Uncharacterized protein n=1 Tax=Bonamia ostreae TaxID=126728 RepID=A0ABV2AER3_9EUKA
MGNHSSVIENTINYHYTQNDLYKALSISENELFEDFENLPTLLEKFYNEGVINTSKTIKTYEKNISISNKIKSILLVFSSFHIKNSNSSFNGKIDSEKVEFCSNETLDEFSRKYIWQTRKQLSANAKSIDPYNFWLNSKLQILERSVLAYFVARKKFKKEKSEKEILKEKTDFVDQIFDVKSEDFDKKFYRSVIKMASDLPEINGKIGLIAPKKSEEDLNEQNLQDSLRTGLSLNRPQTRRLVEELERTNTQNTSLTQQFLALQRAVQHQRNNINNDTSANAANNSNNEGTTLHRNSIEAMISRMSRLVRLNDNELVRFFRNDIPIQIRTNSNFFEKDVRFECLEMLKMTLKQVEKDNDEILKNIARFETIGKTKPATKLLRYLQKDFLRKISSATDSDKNILIKYFPIYCKTILNMSTKVLDTEVLYFQRHQSQKRLRSYKRRPLQTILDKSIVKMILPLLLLAIFVSLKSKLFYEMAGLIKSLKKFSDNKILKNRRIGL